MLKESWGYVMERTHKDTETILKGSHWSNLGQMELGNNDNSNRLELFV